MKKISLLVCFLVCVTSAFSQFTRVPAGGSPTSLSYFRGAVSGDSGIVVADFVDTAHANLNSNIRLTAGIMIKVANIVYIRNATVNRWLQFGTVTGATNGLSLSGTNIQLGHNPMSQNDTLFTTNSNFKFVIAPIPNPSTASGIVINLAEQGSNTGKAIIDMVVESFTDYGIRTRLLDPGFVRGVVVENSNTPTLSSQAGINYNNTASGFQSSNVYGGQFFQMYLGVKNNPFADSSLMIRTGGSSGIQFTADNSGYFWFKGGVNNLNGVYGGFAGLGPYLGNWGVGTMTPDSAITVALGLWGKRGVRFNHLPSALNDTSNYLPIAYKKSDSSLAYMSSWPVGSGGGGTGVTNVATGIGVTGGPITTTGTISLDTSYAATKGTTQVWNGHKIFTATTTDFKPGTDATNTVQYWNANGDIIYSAGTYPGFPSYYAAWAGSAAASPTGSNFFVFSNGPQTVFNGGNSLAFRTADAVSPGSALSINSGGQIGFSNDSPDAGFILALGTAGSVTGSWEAAGSTAGTIKFVVPANFTPYTMNWPTSSGTAGQYLKSGGGGVTAMTFDNPLFAGSFSGVGAATTVFTVTIGTTMANTTYKVNVTPTAALSAAIFYVTNKTTTTFDVTYLAGLSGAVTFDWSVFP